MDERQKDKKRKKDAHRLLLEDAAAGLRDAMAGRVMSEKAFRERLNRRRPHPTRVSGAAPE